MNNDEANKRFDEAVPMGLTHLMGGFYPAKTRHHLLGAVGEDGDKSIPSEIPPDPIVNNQPGGGASAATNKRIIVIDDDMVARYYKIYVVPDGVVP